MTTITSADSVALEQLEREGGFVVLSGRRRAAAAIKVLGPEAALRVLGWGCEFAGATDASRDIVAAAPVAQLPKGARPWYRSFGKNRW